jgi:D-3-phosphoglycerate dehydrogenase / 2-oxoglutarate reductase
MCRRPSAHGSVPDIFMSKVLVTPRSVTKSRHPSLAVLQSRGYELVFCSPGKMPSEEELVALVPDCIGYLAGVERIGPRVLDAARRLRVISRNGTGVDNIDLAKAREKNIVICKAEGANSRGVAELAIAHILCAARSIAFSDRSLKAGGWERRKGIELERRTLGLIGCGAIGKLVARLVLGLDMQVLAYDPLPDPAFQPSSAFRYAGLNEVLSTSEVISLHCPGTADAKPLVNVDTIAQMRDGVYIVNTARAGLLDDDAVLAALDSGKIAGLALDVFTEEPPRDRRLVEHPRTVATAHIGGFTVESVDRAVTVAVENLVRALEGTPHAPS